MAIEGENIVIVINMVIIMCNPVMKKLWSKLLNGYLK